IAGLDLGAMTGRLERPDRPWRQWFALADSLDGDPRRAELRKFLADSPAITWAKEKEKKVRAAMEEMAGTLGQDLSWLSQRAWEKDKPNDAARSEAIGRDLAWLKKRAGEADPARDPILEVLLLAQALSNAGEVDRSVTLLRAATSARP